MTATPRHYLAISAVFRDEAANLREWLEFHLLVGVEHFFLYNNLSQDSYADVLAPYIARGQVTLIDWPHPFSEGGQPASYQDCLANHGFKTRWLSTLDLDEFLFSPEAETLPEVLREFEDYPGVVVNWQNFGSGGHDEAPSPLVTESFTRRAPQSWVRNRRVKSIIDPSRAIGPVGPHFFRYKDDALAVTENFKPVRIVVAGRIKKRIRRLLVRFIPALPIDPYPTRESSVRKVSVSRLRINHYVVKSRAAHRAKVARWSAEGSNPGRMARSKAEFRFHDRNDVEDDSMQRFLPRLRAALEQSETQPANV